MFMINMFEFRNTERQIVCILHNIAAAVFNPKSLYYVKHFKPNIMCDDQNRFVSKLLKLASIKLLSKT